MITMSYFRVRVAAGLVAAGCVVASQAAAQQAAKKAVVTEPTVALTQSELATYAQGVLAESQVRQLQPLIQAAMPIADKARRAFQPSSSPIPSTPKTP